METINENNKMKFPLKDHLNFKVFKEKFRRRVNL